MIIAKLIPPKFDKSWTLQFFDVPKDEVVRANIWYQARHFGEFFHVSPFKQGDSEDWIMVEFWSSSQCHILEACINICQQLDIELQLD